MKSIFCNLLFLAIVIFCPIAGNAQNAIGVHTGIILSNQKYSAGSFAPQRYWKPGFAAGVFFEENKTSYFNLLAELNFVQKGAYERWEITTEDFPEGSGEYKDIPIETAQIQLGVYPKFYFERNNFEPFVFAGPRVDVVVDKSGIGPSLNERNVNRAALGVAYGLGVAYKFDKIKLSLRLQGDNDLTSFYRVENSSHIDGYKIKNNAFLGLFGVAFFL